MSSNTEICNIALSHLGVGKEISNLETEQSQGASACRRFYDTALEEVLRDFKWAFATKIEALALIESTPNEEWDYSYRYPTNCIAVRRILSGFRNDTRQSRVPYKIAFDDSGRIIYSDEQDAKIEYTFRVEDPQYYPSDFIMAFSYRLATLLAPRLTGGDPFALMEKTQKLYDMHIFKAAKNSFNEEQPDEEVESEFVRTREG